MYASGESGRGGPSTSNSFERPRFDHHNGTLDGGVERRRHEVTIVGGGPVGLATALGLANHGIRSVLIEADDSVCSGSRAICISRRSLEIIERLGALERFLDVGLPWTGGRSFYQNDEVLHFAMPQDENQKLPPMINLAQYHIEQYLLDAAEKRPDLIEIRWQTRVTKVEQHGDAATLHLSTPAGDYVLDTDWLVASDGGRSTIREQLGLPLRGSSYEGRYVIVDVSLRSDRPTERLACFDPSSNPGSTVLVHKQPDDVWRIDYQLRDDENADEAVKPENVIPRVQSLFNMMGESGQWAPIWITVYKAHALTLERYRHGNVLFAGDAAHLVPIFGVRGANSGIDDADNLAWKLAYVIKGVGGDHLLDSYSDERVFAAHENLDYGTKSTEFMAPPTFAFELMRRAVLSLAVRHAGVRSLINPRQTSAIVYTDSPLNVPERGTFDSGPVPGSVLSECPLNIVSPEGARVGYLTDFVGPCFTAFVFGISFALHATFTALADTWAARGVPLRCIAIAEKLRDEAEEYGWDHTGRLFPMYGAHPGTIYLVRPDGRVLGRWHDGSTTDISAALEHVC